MRFIYPTHGDMLTDAAGRRTKDGGLVIEVCVQSAKAVSVNGIPTEQQKDGTWKTEVELSAEKQTLTARTEKEECSIVVYRLPKATDKYALSVDDNIWWLAELTLFPRNSIFEHPYLAVYRRMHEKYGAKVRFNLFYQVDEQRAERYNQFNLSMMTDRYREEFIQNADWLHLAFHSFQESPAFPYQNASCEEVARDWKLVEQEIIRFAGEETLERATTIHFGSCTEEGIHALKAGGVHALMGFMELDRRGKPSVSYNLSVERVLQTQRYGFWLDENSGMIYGKIDVVMNSYSPDKIVKILSEQKAAHPLRGFVEIMIHEQYFYEDYTHYEADYEARIAAGCRWCVEQGYTGAFVEEVI